ncbi:MAG: hypothetical protein Q8N05_12320, partial [Bacteroidota bacterium]|nr:hypothetical protein [Bacteroidota bacterium]
MNLHKFSRRNKINIILICLLSLESILSSVVYAQEQNTGSSLPSCIVERLNDPALVAKGDTKIYSGKYLDAI